ncbi:retroviral-like aspartic protease family protein [Sphingomonas sp. NSE70-1]|uniref:Retroviral-like aspartic protease family protein n=1 Tax=Sphingomonas caseinilyticus TaxID=2908205 RepID=A0ABT0RS97_9SPHN|nr:retroviral-like aspartic protease family protein [Sphingomonas caseinilyticus]MCL6697870.1 retroviral-like aspartic protease family protein [Sphingomonas caseinilyticus]
MAGTPIAAEPQRLDIEVGVKEQIDNITTSDEVALSSDGADRMTVPVSVGGTGPYQFLVDTGSERTVISKELAKQLRLTSGRSAVLHSVMGANNIDTVHIPRLQVSSNTISVVDAPALGASNIGADGMLGIDSLRSQRVLFNFKSKTMSITPSNQPLERLEGDTIVVRARSKDGRLIFTKAKIDGQRVSVIVDTGSQVTIANMALRKLLMKKGHVPIPETVTIESVTGEQMSANVTRVAAVELGGVTLTDLSIAFADAHIFRQLDLDDRPALLLGMNAMKAFDQISIDFAAKKVRFVLPSTSMRKELRVAAATS